MATADEQWMQLALEEARLAWLEGEVPVGAVAVVSGELLARAHNRVIALDDPTAHAEILAIRAAAAQLQNYRIESVELYATIEPCPMCAGVMVHARLARLCYGAGDEKAGAAGSVFQLLDGTRLNHRVEVTRGVLEPECGALIQEFFRQKRSSRSRPVLP